MPYSYYGRMDREDIYDIIAYVRSIPSVPNEVPASAPDFPMNIILNTIPHKEIPQTKPSSSDILAYGAYMTNASACAECHTKVEKGQIIQELKFGGGRDFNFLMAQQYSLPTLHLIPKQDLETGQRKCSSRRFKVYADSSFIPAPVAPGEFNSIMPWMMYAKMKREDLAAIFAYLKTVSRSIILL